MRKSYMPGVSLPAMLAGLRLRAEVQPSAKMIADLTDELKRVNAAMDAKCNEVAKNAEAALAQAKDKGKLLEETKADVDKMLVAHTVESSKLQGKINELTGRLTAAEQLIVQRPGPGGTASHKTLGQSLIEDDGFKAWAQRGASGLRGKYRLGLKAATTSLDYPVSAPSVIAPYIVPGIQSLPKQRLFIRDLIPVVAIDSPLYSWVRKTGFTNNADVVSEGTLKPESTISFDVQSKPVTTIAHIFKASKQIMDDFKALRGEVDLELRYGLKYVEEQEILFGDGTGIHLLGIVPQATAFSAAFEPAFHQRIDDIRLAMLQAQLARRPATGIVMHFTDWAHIELTKDANGQYLFANPLRLAGETLWGLPIVPTEINAFESRFLVGGFATGARILDREEMGVEIATENEDDFVKNMITIRCEERIGLAVLTPESFVYGTFAAGSGT